MSNIDLGKKLRAARKELALTQDQLAGTSFTKSFISQVEHGRAMPSLESLQLLAARLKKPLSYFTEPGLEEKIHRLDLANKLGAERLRRGAWEEGLLHFTEALALAREINDQFREGIACLNIGQAYLKGGDHQNSLEHFEKGLALFEEIPDWEHLAMAGYFIGLAHYQVQNFQGALDWYKKAQDALQHVSGADIYFEAALQYNASLAYNALERNTEALSRYAQALELCGGIADLEQMSTVYLEKALSMNEKGDLSGALEAASSAEGISRAIARINLVANIENNMAAILVEQGQLDRAFELLEKSLEIQRRMNNRSGEARNIVELARCHYLRGEPGKAEELAQYGLDLLHEEDRETAARLYKLLGMLARGRQSWEDAVNFFERSIEICQELDLQRELAEAYYELGNLLTEKGEMEKANRYLKEAFELTRRLRTGRQKEKAANS